MATTAAANGNSQPIVTAVPELRVFRSPEYTLLHSALALALLLGSIHLTAALSLTATLLFPSRLAFAILGLLVCLMAIPLNDKSKLGQKLSKYICKYSCGYFPVTLHVEDLQAFDPNQAYVFGFEPHSVLPIGVVAFANHVGFMPLPKVKVLASSAAFRTPFLRQIWTWLGLVPASKKNFLSYLEAGYSCVVVPGGAREIIYMDHDSEVAFLKGRKGFVRIAMEMGRPLVPVFCFGQSKTYSWWKPKGRIYSLIVRAIKFTPILFWGVFGSPIPYRHPMHVFVGRPIEVKRNTQPTIEEVDEIHHQFVAAIKEIFENHKINAGYPELNLKII